MGLRPAHTAAVIIFTVWPAPSVAYQVAVPPLSPEQLLQYQLRCSAAVDSPTIFTSSRLDETKSSANISDFDTFKFIPTEFVSVQGHQYLKGFFFTGMLQSGLAFGYDWYVLPSEWDCRLYRGDQPWLGGEAP